MRILITGAASGIGKATAEEAVERGHEVVGIDRDAAVFEHPDITFHHLDIYHSDEIEEVVEEEEFDVLVNCAGYFEQGSIEDMPVETVEEIYRSNVFGLLRVTRTALPQLREKEGKVINISSIAGRVTVPFMGQYCSSKKAVEAISDALRLEMKGKGIDVVVVEPGVIETGFNERARQAIRKYMPESIYTDKYEEILEKGGRGGVEADVPARKIVNVIETDNPRRRYQTPFRAKLITALSHLRHFIKDRIITVAS